MSPKKKNTGLKNLQSLVPKNLNFKKFKVKPSNVIEDTKNKIGNFYSKLKLEREKEKKRQEKRKKNKESLRNKMKKFWDKKQKKKRELKKKIEELESQTNNPTTDLEKFDVNKTTEN